SYHAPVRFCFSTFKTLHENNYCAKHNKLLSHRNALKVPPAPDLGGGARLKTNMSEAKCAFWVKVRFLLRHFYSSRILFHKILEL
ncbi:hypothetical protein, partial [Acinetobacter sp. YH12057]|uniref:hypothetical protein n=1 Tax=Acinetobacter sp. YH12057 TaxID=2601057 RepID=UPI001C5524CD